MPSTQKIVQVLLCWSTPLLVLAALGGTTMDGIFAVGRILTEPRPTILSNSPSGNYRALLYRHDTDGQATTKIVLEHHWHGIFLGSLTALESSPAATVQLRWTKPEALHLICTGCDPVTTDLPRRNWGRLHLAYDFR